MYFENLSAFYMTSFLTLCSTQQVHLVAITKKETNSFPLVIAFSSFSSLVVARRPVFLPFLPRICQKKVSKLHWHHKFSSYQRTSNCIFQMSNNHSNNEIFLQIAQVFGMHRLSVIPSTSQKELLTSQKKPPKYQNVRKSAKVT